MVHLPPLRSTRAVAPPIGPTKYDGFKHPLPYLMACLVIILWLTNCQGILKAQTSAPPPDAPRVYSAQAYYYFSLAQLKLGEGDLVEAIWLMEKAIGFDPQSNYLKLELANAYLTNKESAKALGMVQKVLDQEPEYIPALTLLGKIYQQQGNTTAAQKAFEKVLAADGADLNIFLFLGRLYWDSKDMVNAGRVFSKMTTRFPDSYVAYYFYGKVLAAQGDENGAEAAFLKSLVLEPSLEEPRLELLKIYRRQNQNEKLIQTYKDILENNPDNYEAMLGLARYYRQIDEPHAAAELLSDLGRLAQEDDDVIRTLYENYLEPKDFKTATWALEGMLRGAPDNSDLNYLMGVSQDGLSQNEAALKYLQKVAPGTRFYHNAVVLGAMLFHDGGNIGQAIAMIEEALHKDSPHEDYYLYLGTFLEEQERYEDAVEALKQGLKVDSQNSRLYFRLGVVFDKMGRKDDSIEAMKSVVRLKPDNAEALNYLGYTYADLGVNLEEAEALIQSAMKIKPGDGYITDSLGWLNYKKGRYQDALRYLNRAVELVPDDPVIMEHLGDVYLKLNLPQKAIFYYQRSLEKKNKNKAALEEKINQIRKNNSSDDR